MARPRIANRLPIAGLHLTSRRPCWRSRTKAFLSSENYTLFSCKFFEEIFFCFDPQHGCLVTWLQTKNSISFSPFLHHCRISERFQRAFQPNAVNSRVLHGLFDVVLNSRQWEVPEQKLSQILTLLEYFLTFAPMLDNFRSFQSTRNSGTK